MQTIRIIQKITSEITNAKEECDSLIDLANISSIEDLKEIEKLTTMSVQKITVIAKSIEVKGDK